jgi:hypothetical protein
MQQLLEGVGTGNGSTGVPLVIGGKCQNDDNDSLSLSKKARLQMRMRPHLKN